MCVFIENYVTKDKSRHITKKWDKNYCVLPQIRYRTVFIEIVFGEI